MGSGKLRPLAQAATAATPAERMASNHYNSREDYDEHHRSNRKRFSANDTIRRRAQPVAALRGRRPVRKRQRAARRRCGERGGRGGVGAVRARPPLGLGRHARPGAARQREPAQASDFRRQGISPRRGRVPSGLSSADGAGHGRRPTRLHLAGGRNTRRCARRGRPRGALLHDPPD
jgi:hypothetical protein